MKTTTGTIEEYLLIQVKKKHRYLHGVSDNVSSLIEHYYKNRQQHGYMEVVDNNNKTLVTLGSNFGTSDSWK